MWKNVRNSEIRSIEIGTPIDLNNIYKKTDGQHSVQSRIAIQYFSC